MDTSACMILTCLSHACNDNEESPCFRLANDLSLNLDGIQQIHILTFSSIGSVR